MCLNAEVLTMTGDDYGKPRQSSAAARKRMRKRFALLFISIGFICLLLYLYQVFACSRYQPTGEALFDTYARAVIARQKWRLFKFSVTTPTSYVPDKTIASWEDEFGSDPRYWELRYWCMLQSGITIENGLSNGPSDEALERATALLEQARSQGVSSSTMLFCLFDSYSSNEARVQANSLYTPTSAEKQDLQHAEDLLDELAEEYPDFAWAYYIRALRMVGENFDGAIELIAQGNQAADKDVPRCFPIDFVKKDLSQPQSPSRELVYGSILSLEYYGSPLEYYRFQDSLESLAIAAMQPLPTQTREVLFKFGCNIGGASNSGFIDVAYGSQLARDEIRGALANRPPQLTDEQARVLAVFAHRLDELRLGLAYYNSAVSEMLRMLEEPGWTRGITRGWPYYPPSMLDNQTTHGVLYQYYNHSPNRWRLLCDVESTNQLELGHARAVFKEVSQLRLAAPELPRNWSDAGTRPGYPEFHADEYKEGGWEVPPTVLNPDK
jgi:hypothetical protein